MERRTRLVLVWGALGFFVGIVVLAVGPPLAVAWQCYRDASEGERAEALGRVAIDLAHAGRADEARDLIWQAGQVVAKLEAENAKRQEPDDGADEDGWEDEWVDDGGYIRIELAGALGALGDRIAAMDQVARTTSADSKAQALALLAASLAKRDGPGAAKAYLQQAVGELALTEDEYDQAWAAFFVGRDIARSGHAAFGAEWLAGLDPGIVKAYAAAGLAWGGAMAQPRGE